MSQHVKAPSFSTPQALQVYLKSIKDGSCTLSDNGVTTTVNVEIETVPPLDDGFGKTPWTDNDHKIFESLKSPNNTSKYSPYQSYRQLPDGSTSTAATEFTSAADKEKVPGT